MKGAARMDSARREENEPSRLTDEQVAKDIDRLTLFQDGFLQYCLQNDIKAVQRIFSVILGEPDLKLESLVTEKAFPGVVSRGVRLDAFAKDDHGRFLNLEVQRDRRGATIRRAELNFAAILSAATMPGTPAIQTPDVGVVFATVADVLRGGRPFYRFRLQDMETGLVPDSAQDYIFISLRNQDPGSPRGKLMADFAQPDPDRMNFAELAAPVRHFKKEEGRRMLENYVRETYAKQFDAVALRSREEGSSERARSAALNFLSMGLSPEQVAKGAELPLEEVLRLQREREMRPLQ